MKKKSKKKANMQVRTRNEDWIRSKKKKPKKRKRRKKQTKKRKKKWKERKTQNRK